MQANTPRAFEDEERKKVWHAPQCTKKSWHTPQFVAIDFSQTRTGGSSVIPERSSGTGS
jgi:hypothetical protein